MSVTIAIEEMAEVSGEGQAKLRAMKAAVYPDTTPETIANRAREWEPPRWGVFVSDESGELLSYTGIVIRDASVETEPKVIGGVGGIATHPAHRGKGYAPLGIGRALDFLLGRKADFALLVCRDELVSYYSKLGWRLFQGRLLNTQFGEPEEFTFNRVMVGDLNTKAPREGTIDLHGPAW